jgi:hypothetical protein
VIAAIAGFSVAVLLRGALSWDFELQTQSDWGPDFDA